MGYFNNKNNVALLLIIVGAMLFFMFIMPMVDKNYNKEQNNMKEQFNSAPVNFTKENVVKIDTNKCSKDCCGLSQYPLPDGMLNKTIPSDELKNYIPSNFSCNFGNNVGSGCVCMTKSDSNYLTHHGNNN
jgi:hypothetical protein